MPPSLPEIDLSGLFRTLSEFGLLSPEQLDSQWHSFRTSGDTVDARHFLQFLTQNQVLTCYQSEQLLSGQVSRLFCGSYLLREPVGTGGLGTVFLAVGREDRIQYAIKVLPLRNLWNVHIAKRQLRDFVSLPAHPTIIPFLTIDSTSWCHYLVWPYVAGETLDRIVRRTGPLSPERAAQYAAQLAEGLSICHQHGIVHGVLKPANILISPDHQPRLLDLGVGAILADNLADEQSLLDTVSSANTAISMMDYSAPESNGEPSNLTVAADAYGLGGILYFMLSGGPPFPDGSAIEKILAQQKGEPVPIPHRNPRVSQEFGDVIARLLTPSPQKRLQDLASVRDELTRFARLPAPPTHDASVYVIPPSISVDPPSTPADSITELPNHSEPRLLGPTESDALSLSSITRSVGPFTKLDHEIPTFEPIPVTEYAPQPSRAILPTTPPQRPAPQITDEPPVTDDFPIITHPVTPPRFSFAIWLRRLARLFRPQLPELGVLQATIFGVENWTVGMESTIQVYLHHPESFAAVQRTARSVNPDQRLLAVCFADRPLPIGATIGVHFSAARMRVVNTLAYSQWTEPSIPVPFMVVVPANCPIGEHPAALSLGWKGTLIGRQELRLKTEKL